MPRRPLAAPRPCGRTPSLPAAPRRPPVMPRRPVTTPAMPRLARHAPSPPLSTPCSIARRTGRAVPLCLPGREDSGGQAEATTRSSSSNSNRRRSIAASNGLFRCAVMNFGEFRADSDKLRGDVFAPTRFHRYTGPLMFNLATSKYKGFACAFSVALKIFTGWTTYTVSVLHTFFDQNCKTQKLC